MSGWSEQEDRIFIRRYLQFTQDGKKMGYSAFVALELPKKTERQIRDRLAVLKNYDYPVGLRNAPGAAPSPTSSETDADEPRSPTPSTEAEINEDEPHNPELTATASGRSQDLDPPDMTPVVITQPNFDLDEQLEEAEPLSLRVTIRDDSSQDMTPVRAPSPVAVLQGEIPEPQNGNEDVAEEGFQDMTPDPSLNQTFRATPGISPERNTNQDNEGAGVTLTPLISEEDLNVAPTQDTPAHAGRPPGRSPPSTPPSDGEVEGAIEEPSAWEAALRYIRTVTPVCPVGQRLKDLAEEEGDIHQMLDDLVVELQAGMVSRLPVEQRRRPPRDRVTDRSERTRRRITRYARTQDLYKKNPSRLAEMALKNELGDLLRDAPRVEPPKASTMELYSRLWGTAVESTLDLPRREPGPDNDIQIFTKEELRKRIGKLKAGGAPGLDGVTKRAISAYEGATGTLVVLYNICLFRSVYPTVWLRNRTTLIPKPGKDLARAENWRPITISPLLARLYSSGIEARLAGLIHLSDRQRGFRPGNGCLINCTILDEVIRLGKRTELVGVQLDVSKAFDTVSHAAIATVLGAQSVPTCMQRTIQLMYSGAATDLTQIGESVNIKRGVKQGDPLSPLLFNLVLDPLLQDLQRSGKGFTVGAQKLAAMAYADDVTLFAAAATEMGELLDMTSDYLSSVGMSLSAGKCGGFHLRRSGRSGWVAIDTELRVQGTPITNFGVADRFTYLGLDYSLHHGFANRQHMDTLVAAAGRVRRLSLKPHQKVNLLMCYVVPAFAHRMTIDPPSTSELLRVDTRLRGEVKKILHLHPTTTDGILYTRKRDGGLGVPHLVQQVKICALRAGLQLVEAEDPLLQQLGREADWVDRMGRLAGQLGLQFPTTLQEINSRKRALKEQARQNWEAQPSQGVGVAAFKNDPVANFWLLNQTALKPGQLIDALKFRTNTYGTRVAINRETRRGITDCRRCHAKPETLGHVIGECIAGKRARIERHNWVVGRIAEHLQSSGAVVGREQTFYTSQNVQLKPDIVYKAHDAAIILDVTVPFENGNSLREAAAEKVRKYSALLPVVQQQLQATRGEVIPVVLGARGAIPPSTVTALKKLGLASRRTLIDFSLAMLRTSIDIGRAHLDYGDRRPRQVAGRRADHQPDPP